MKLPVLNLAEPVDTGRGRVPGGLALQDLQHAKPLVPGVGVREAVVRVAVLDLPGEVGADDAEWVAPRSVPHAAAREHSYT